MEEEYGEDEGKWRWEKWWTEHGVWGEWGIIMPPILTLMLLSIGGFLLLEGLHALSKWNLIIDLLILTVKVSADTNCKSFWKSYCWWVLIILSEI